MTDITHYGIILHLLEVPAKKKSVPLKVNKKKNLSPKSEDALVHSFTQEVKSPWITAVDSHKHEIHGSGNLLDIKSTGKKLQAPKKGPFPRI